MIVKIWPIKADGSGSNGKVGGVEGLINTVEYMMDKEKVLVRQDDVRDRIPYERADAEQNAFSSAEEDISRTVRYMAREDKTEAKYVSGYLCSAESVVQDFRAAAELLGLKSKGKVKPNRGAMGFHIVQSFPENLDISDAEVHECGLDLVRRLGNYQALVCSHVHPVEDAQGESHGNCKHNHILINAFMHPDFYDPDRKMPGKYHNCIASYRQLQVYNDEVAIEHGLPIIRNPDMERVYTWKESDEINKGTSWRERIRMDIETYRRVARNWEDFLQILTDEGYQVVQKKSLTYISPDGNHARASKLGARYTKESLEVYWAVRNHVRDSIQRELNLNQEPILSDFVYNYKGNLTVKLPVGPQFLEDRKFVYMPLNKDTRANEEALRSYMDMDKLYDICDESMQPVAAASGIEILRSIEDLRDEGRMAYRAQVRMRAEEVRTERARREAEQEEEKQKKSEYFFNRNFYNSRTGRIYRAEFFDEDGRRRSPLELMFVLALVILDKESYLWVPRGEATEQPDDDVYYATSDRKLKSLVEAMEIAKAEKLDSQSQLKKRLDAVGADHSRAKKGYGNASRAAARMEPLAAAVADYRKTKDIAEGIHAMPDGEEKTNMQQKYEDEIERYKAAKHAMYVSGLDDEESLAEFEARYQRITKDVLELKIRMKERGEHYFRLKKLEYGLQLAQDPKYIYGVSYPGPDHLKQEFIDAELENSDLWHKLGDAQARTEGQNTGQAQEEARDEKRKGHEE